MIYCQYEFEAGKFLHTAPLNHLIQSAVWFTALCDLSPTTSNHNNNENDDRYSNKSIWIIIETDKTCVCEHLSNVAVNTTAVTLF